MPALVHSAGCRPSARESYSLHFILEETIAVASLFVWPVAMLAYGAFRTGPGHLRGGIHSGSVCDTGAMPEPVIPMSTTDTLPQGLQQDHVVSRAAVLTSRGHPNPGSARDGLADWAQRCNYNAVVGVRFVAVPEIVTPAEVLTDVKWTAYGTAIGW